MNTNTLFFKRIAFISILFVSMVSSTHAALTDLATAPITVKNTSLQVLPNILFVLDDSGSMQSDFLPDWADPLLSFSYLYKNAAYNGVAYNPAVYYKPPVMYTSAGTLDITTYKSQTSANTSDWTAVKNDGYGVQSTATSVLKNNAYFYTTIPGEYCDSPQLRNCVASTIATGSYTKPAKLRWCDTPAAANGSTANANGHCQAAQIASTATNTANGVKSYTFPRSPSLGGVSSISFTGVGGVTVSGITIGATTAQIMSVVVNNTVAINSDGSSLPGLLNAITNSINACTATAVGACTVSGYSAVSDGISVISISAPAVTTLTPVVNMTSTIVPITNPDGSAGTSHVVATAAAFAQTPGSILKTVVTSTTLNYPLPGSTVKSANRSDCAGTTCTYDEEMTNYANWWAYYHTRMQTMKTDVSIAFSILDDEFRVGYFSINNGSYRNPSNPNINNDYLDIAAFGNSQKYSWYTKIFNAYPYGQTPLRIALSNAGRMYAGKLTSLNNTSVTDPMQYSCQQNFTILSTDGYWNDQTVPKQIDGTTDIGQQDGLESRPYYDGATQVQTVSQTLKSVKQVGSYETTLQSKTTQQYKSSSDLTQTVTTTDTYPWQVQTSTLQTSTSQLQSSTRALQTSTTKLQSSTYNLVESAFQPNTSTYPLITSNFLPQISTYQLVQSNFQPTTNTYPLNQTIFNPNTNTYVMQKKDYNPTVSSYALTASDFKPTQSSYALSRLDYQPQISTFALQSTTYQLQSTTTLLNKTTYPLQSSTSQLQVRVKFSNNGGDTYTDTGWQNATSSCTPGTVTASNGDITITACQYTGYTAFADVSGSCSTVNPSTASPYTVLTAVKCQYSSTPAVTSGFSSCTANAQQTSSPYNPQVTCAYGTAGAATNVSSCTTVAQSTSSPFQAAVSCAYSAGVNATVTSCSTVAKSTVSPYSVGTAVDCAYQAAVVTSGSTCTVTAKQTASPYSGPAVTCGYSGTASSTLNNQSSCTIATRATGTTTGSVYGTATDCSYGSASNSTVSTCSIVSKATATTNGTVYTGPAIGCAYPGTATTTAGSQTSCTITARATATSNGTSYPTARDCTYATTATTSSASTCTVVSQSTGTTTGTVYSGPAIGCSYPTTATTTTPNVSCTTVAGATATTNGTTYSPKTDCAYSTTASTTSGTSCTVVTASTSSPYSASYNTCTYPGTATTTNPGVTSCTTVAGQTATTNGSVYNAKTNCAYATTPTTATAATCTSVAASTSSPYAGPYKTCTYPGTATSTANVATCTPIAQSTSNTYQTAVTCGYATTATVTNGTCTVNTGTITAGVYTGNRVSCSYPGTASTTASGVACTTVARQTSAANGAVWAQATDCAYSGTATVTSGSTCSVQTGSTASPYTIVNKVSCAYPGTATTSNTVSSCSTVARATATNTGTSYPTAKDCAYSTTAAVASNLDSCTSVNRSTSSPYSGPAVDCAYQTAAVTTGTSCTVLATTTTPVTNGNTYTKGVACAYTSPVVATVTSCTPAAASTGPTNYSGPAVSCAYTAYTAPANATAACTQAAQSTSGTYTGPAVNCTYTAPATTYSGSCTSLAQNNTNLTARTCTAGSYPFLISTVQSIVSSCTPGHPSTTTSGVTRDIATTCAYNPYTNPAPALCSAVAQSTPTTNGVTYPTAVNCTTGGDLDFVNVPSCISAGTISPLAYDSSGKIVQCRTTAPTAVVPVNTCIASTGPGPAYTQTNCQTLQDSVTPVQTCTPSTTSDFVNTTCDSSSIQSNIAICTPQLPTANNGYRTVTCGSTGGTSNTLADVAQYYYKTDLRTTAFGNCVGAPAGSTNTSNLLCADPDDAYNNVPTNGVDLNPAQHMTTFTLGLGASGFMQYTDNYNSGGSSDYESIKTVTTADPANGICSWQNGGDCNWPFPINNDQTGVDDLWHAGVNGRASYFSATDPTSLANSLATALSSVSASRGSSSGASTSSANVTATNNYIFSSTFATGSWDGELVRSQINTADGSVNPIGGWAAQAKLDIKPYASRTIYTFDNSSTNKLKSFDVANYGGNTAGSANFKAPNINASVTGLTQFLCTSPTICLNSADQALAAGDNLINFIRGDRSNEGALTDNTKYYRQRSHVLGDIVNSTATYVAGPQYLYADAGYNSFASSNANRLPVVYVGSNDGMLHAFRGVGSASTEQALALYRADTSNGPNQTAAITAQNADILAGIDGGRELWAYIPSMVLPNLYKLADKNYSALHQYFVDGIQETADICVSSCGTSAAVWKTILVGGLGRGGRGYFALDITDPENPKGIWEYTDTNLGYTYGNPQIVKQADGTWVVVFSSGYNNVANSDGSGGDGQGRLYVLNAYTGEFIRSIPTGIGNTTTPSGLSKITAEVANGLVDSTVEAVYGGDLLGNLWRFDINNNTGATGYDAQLMVTLSDGSGNRQPLTAKPTIALVDNNTVVYVGTGQYLAASDVNAVNTQSIYAIKDPFRTDTTPSVAIYNNPRSTGSTFVRQVQSASIDCPNGTLATICVPGQPVKTTTNNTVDFATNGGWFVDLVDSGERANTDLLYALNLLVFSTNVPSAAACNLGGYSYIYFLDYRTGGPASSSTTSVSGISLGNHLSAAPVVIGTGVSAGGTALLPCTSCATGYNTPKLPPNPTPDQTRRTSWRELISP